MKAYTILKMPPKNKLIWGFDYHSRMWFMCVWTGEMKGECHVLRPWVHTGIGYDFTHWGEATPPEDPDYESQQRMIEKLGEEK